MSIRTRTKTPALEYASAFIRRDAFILTVSVLAAFVSRFFVLLVGRPEFVGWFNHSPYFWVQTRSLVETGALAYGDMPLLFVLYAAVAKAMVLFGVSMEPAIILASRLVMTIAPAVLPISIYILARQAKNSSALTWPTKSLVLASGFLPLTFANMPEHLQKNMLGLVLLAFAFLVLFQWYRTRKINQPILFLVLLLAICLSHLGTALAAVLLVAALIIDSLLRRASLADILRLGLVSAVVILAVGLGIRAFDPSAIHRVYALLSGLVPASPGGAFVSLLLLSLWAGLVLVLWRWFAHRAMDQDAATAALGRTTILWIGLLAMPLWPGEIGVRLLLFIPLGVIIFLLVALQVFGQARIFRGIAATVTVAFIVMSVGEAASLLMIYPDKDETARQLAAAADKYRLSRSDLVITPYGAGPIANWFLGTKASLLTAIHRDSAEHYDRLFVLNTLERSAPQLEPGECRLLTREDDRYWASRHDIPLGEDAKPDTDYDRFAFYRLERFPDTWVFDNDGQWIGWGQGPESCGSSQR